MKRILFILSFLVSVAHAQNVGTIMRSDLTKKIPHHWQRKGVVLQATDPSEGSNNFEPTVLREANPQILTQYDTVFKMWYSSGWVYANICYAESVDGVNWTKYSSNPVISNHNRGFVIKNSTTYHLYCATTGLSNGNQIDHYTSTNGLSWTLANAAIISKNTASWNINGVFNTSVLIDGATWYLLVDGISPGTGYSQGLYTSSDGQTWTAYGGNPVMTGKSQGASFIKKIGSKYYAWVLGDINGGEDILPTDLMRFSSPDMHTWTQTGANTTFARRMEDEGAQVTNGQVADPYYIEVGNSVYLYYAASPDGADSTARQQIKLAIINVPFSELVQTDEGDGGDVNTIAASSGGGSSQFDNVTGGINYSGGNVGVGNTTPTYPIDVIVNANSSKAVQIQNTSTGSGAIAQFSTRNSAVGGAAFGITSTGYTPYGILGANTAHFYTDRNMAFISDGGYMQFGTASGTLRMQIAATGVTINGSGSDYTLPTSRPAGNGYSLTGNTDGTTAWTNVGGGSSQWTTYDANTLVYTGASSHSSAQVNSPSGFAAYLQTVSGTDAQVRMQAGSTAGFIGTLSNHPFSLYGNSVEAVKVQTTGTVTFPQYTTGTANFDGSGNITSSSDRRIKHSIKPFNYGLRAIMKLKPSSFIYNQDSSNTRMSGFIAQDVQKAIPTAVHANKEGILSLEINAIIATLVNAVKEQQAQIDALKKEIATLKK